MVVVSTTGKLVSVSVKIPERIHKEILLRIPEGDRSKFIRDAVIEKLEKTSPPDKILALEKKISILEQEFAEVKKYLVELEVLTHQRGKINPHTFCIDEIDHKIVDYLTHYKGGTTPELAEHVGSNRWLILNRLRRIQKLSRKQLGEPVITYYAGEKAGKKRAWWIVEELVET